MALASVRQSSSQLVDYLLTLERQQKNKHTGARREQEESSRVNKYQVQHARSQACEGYGLSHVDVGEVDLSIMFSEASYGESLGPGDKGQASERGQDPDGKRNSCIFFKRC